MIASTLRLVALGCAIALAAPADAADYDLYGDSLWWRLVPPGGGAASEIVGTAGSTRSAAWWSRSTWTPPPPRCPH